MTSTFIFQRVYFSRRLPELERESTCIYVDQGSAAVHHSSTKAKLKYLAGKGRLSFPAAFFCFFFWQANKKKHSMQITKSHLKGVDARGKQTGNMPIHKK